MTKELPKVRQSEPNGITYRDDFLNVDFALIPTGGNATAHAPALIETEDGGMLCAWSVSYTHLTLPTKA